MKQNLKRKRKTKTQLKVLEGKKIDDAIKGNIENWIINFYY